MFDRDQIIDLYREHRDGNILSVYIDADQQDPAQRGVWRVRLQHGLEEERRRIEAERKGSSVAGAGDLDAFEAAKEHIMAAIGVDGASFLPGRGWVGFASADAILHAESLNAPVPDLTRWERGVRIAPYLRALKWSRSALVALIDHRRGRLLRYREGTVRPLADLHADTYVGDLTDMGSAKRATDRSGVRGQTATDAAQTILNVASDRLAARLASQIVDLSEHVDVLFVGGEPGVTAELMRQLPSRTRELKRDIEGLHVAMPLNELVREVESTMASIEDARSDALLEEAVEQARSGGRGALGSKATEAALRERRVQTLLLSERLCEERPDYADVLIGTALGANGGKSYVLTREAGGRLDEAGDGVAAILHYTIQD